MLLNMELAIRSGKLSQVSGKKVRFYGKYSSVVLRSLAKPRFRKFVLWMLKRERIGESEVGDIKVGLFPCRNSSGNAIAGRCNVRSGEIRIYPKSFKFCRRLFRERGRGDFLSYVKSRAKAALIHELLHLKYESNEEKVMKLTREYFSIYANSRTQESSPDKIAALIFERDSLHEHV